jgi:hypothetical protein
MGRGSKKLGRNEHAKGERYERRHQILEHGGALN